MGFKTIHNMIEGILGKDENKKGGMVWHGW